MIYARGSLRVARSLSGVDTAARHHTLATHAAAAADWETLD